MVTLWCLAGIDRPMVPTFAAVAIAIEPTVEIRSARLDVAEIGRLSPRVLICDVDKTDVDPLELFRRLRFVLPAATIVAYTGNTSRAWAVACHLAGVSCVLAKASDNHRLDHGIRLALENGCYTDPLFSAATAP